MRKQVHKLENIVSETPSINYTDTSSGSLSGYAAKASCIVVTSESVSSKTQSEMYLLNKRLSSRYAVVGNSTNRSNRDVSKG